MFAVVDIETTGSFAADNGITEIGIVLHNGVEVEGVYHSFVNPEKPIPPFVSKLTGIYNYTVADAPVFTTIADKVYNLLRNRIFVAHNVNFDYTFIKHHLEKAGYDWGVNKICTVRLARKVFPGYTKYGLESITAHLGIVNKKAHSAYGDALATAELLTMCYQKGGEAAVMEMLKREHQDHILPPNLPKEQVKILPQTSGVYYFKNAAKKVIYVGKAKNIKQRVTSHFVGDDRSKKRQDFLRHIHHVDCTTTPTEFAAILLESIEIRRLWPAYNVSQKANDQRFGIYVFEDQRGYLRLGIDKRKPILQAIAHTGLYWDAHRILWQMVRKFDLLPGLCFLSKKIDANIPAIDEYNVRVSNAINWVQKQRESFVIQEFTGEFYHCVVVENGEFVGMGNFGIKAVKRAKSLLDFKQKIKKYPSNDTIRSCVYLFKEKYPEKVISF